MEEASLGVKPLDRKSHFDGFVGRLRRFLANLPNLSERFFQCPFEILVRDGGFREHDRDFGVLHEEHFGRRRLGLGGFRLRA